MRWRSWRTSEWTTSMSTSDLPISEAELSALASRLFATSLRPGPDSPPATSAVAPHLSPSLRSPQGRGVAPDVTTATSAGATAAGAAHPGTPAEFVSVPEANLPAPSSPGPEASPPGVAPVAPRGSAVSPVVPFGGFDSFAVPSGLVPTAPGVLAAPPSAPPRRGSRPRYGRAPARTSRIWGGRMRRPRRRTRKATTSCNLLRCSLFR